METGSFELSRRDGRTNSFLGITVPRELTAFRNSFCQKKFLPKLSQKFSIVTLREAKRGSAGVPVAKCEAAGDTQSVQEMTMWRKSFNFECPNSPKTHPNPPQTLPKAIQKASWSPSWTIVLKRYDLERSTSSQNAPKSGLKTLQSVPNPSQMEPRRSQIRFLNNFCACFFLVVNLHLSFAVLRQNLFVFVRVDL